MKNRKFKTRLTIQYSNVDLINDKISLSIPVRQVIVNLENKPEICAIDKKDRDLLLQLQRLFNQTVFLSYLTGMPNHRIYSHKTTLVTLGSFLCKELIVYFLPVVIFHCYNVETLWKQSGNLAVKYANFSSRYVAVVKEIPVLTLSLYESLKSLLSRGWKEIFWH